MAMGKTQHTEKLKEPEKGGAGGQWSLSGRKERRNFKEDDRILTWAHGPLCDIGNARQNS